MWYSASNMLRESELRLGQMGKKGLAKVLAGVREELKAQGIEDLPFPAQPEARTPRGTVQIGRASCRERV